jgi:hypothetical protein
MKGRGGERAVEQAQTATRGGERMALESQHIGVSIRGALGQPMRHLLYPFSC